MPLTGDFWYFPNYAVWVQPDPSDLGDVPKEPALLGSFTLTQAPSRYGDLVVGRDLRKMVSERCLYPDHRWIASAPRLATVSRIMAEIAWDPEAGLLITQRSETHPLLYRTLGSLKMKQLSATAKNKTSDERLHIFHVAIYFGEGLWCTLEATQDFYNTMSQAPRSQDPDATKLQENFSSLFYCPGSIQDPRHFFDGSECAYPREHQESRVRFINLICWHLRALSWPPKGRHLPPDTWTHRASDLGVTANATNTPDRLAEDASTSGGLEVDKTSIVQTMLEQRWLSPEFFLEAARLVEKHSSRPVDWKRRPTAEMRGLEVSGLYHCEQFQLQKLSELRQAATKSG